MPYRFLSIYTIPNITIKKILEDNIIGTPGRSMLYKHLEVDKKVNLIKEPYFACLIKNNAILGTCCFCSRETLNANKALNSFYLRYFTFKTRFHSSPQSKSIRKNTASELRKEIHHLLKGDELGKRAQAPFFHYAYVDPKNSRSVALCNEFGFEPVRKFSTIIFNRISPKINKKIEKLASTEIKEMSEKLTLFYKDHTMFSFENLFKSDEYYVVRDGEGNIIAGVQASPERWKILELPGLRGKAILKMFSVLPYLNRLVDKDYKFVTLEGLYVKHGHEKSLELLFESVLAIHKRYSAMLWLDCDSTLYQTLKSLNLGLLDRINKEVFATIICKFVKVSQEETFLFKKNPAYISGIDLT